MSHGAIIVLHPEFHVEVAAIRGCPLPFGEHGWPVIGMQRATPPVPRGLVGRQPINLLPARIGVGATTIGVGREHAEWGRFTQGAKARLAGDEGSRLLSRFQRK